MELRNGYNPDFLGTGFSIFLPEINLELQNDLLIKEELREGYIADYVHYSLVMSKPNRQALFSAANIDQDHYLPVDGRQWFLDARIGFENQVGPEAYAGNEWDRGHLTRRTAVTWGPSTYVAKRASNDSCSYANASFQHENFNQDEWTVPEEVIRYFDKDLNNKLCVFTGPVFTDADRWYTRDKNNIVRIPSAFWKIVAYIGKESNAIECQAYLMYQDSLFLADKRGRNTIKAENYQVTITEIEVLTGLNFPEVLFNANPLYFFPRKGINKGPEAFIAPAGTQNDELLKGVVFTREDAESEEFQYRKRVIPASALKKSCNNGQAE